MAAEHDPAFDELFAHREWVRALAVRLSHDGAGADDLQQDAWLEALRGAGRARSLRTWLGGVVRHRARKSREREHARRLRERTSARHEAVPGPDELLQRAELERRLLAAVASLPEPYRVAVLLRHYEGLEPDVIARRLGERGSTVRNRLSRAYERLREKLDREYGSGAAWTALAIPRIQEGALVASGAATKLGIAVSLVAIVATAWLWSTHDSNGLDLQPTAAPLAGADADTGSLAAKSTYASATVSERSVAPTAAVARVEHVLLTGRLLGVALEHLADAEMTIVDERGRTARAAIAPDGSYSAFGLVPGRVRIVVTGRALVQHDEDIALREDQERHRHDVTIASAFSVPVRFVSKRTRETIEPDRKGWSGALRVVVTPSPPARIDCFEARVAQRAELGSWIEQQRFVSTSRVVPENASGLLVVRSALPVWASVVLRETVLESRPIDGTERELVFEIDDDALDAKLGALVIRCIDRASAAPIPDPSVMVGYGDGSLSAARADAQGVARFESLVPGLLVVKVHAERYASLETTVRIEPGATCEPPPIALAPCVRFAGRVVGSDGSGVTARVTSLPERDWTTTRSASSAVTCDAATDGTFEVPCGEADRVRLTARRDGFAPAWIDVDSRSTATEGLVLRLEHGTPVVLVAPRGQWNWLSVWICDANGDAIVRCGVGASRPERLWLKPGRYELAVSAAGIVTREELVVGTEPIVHEVRAP